MEQLKNEERAGQGEKKTKLAMYETVEVVY